MVSKRTGKAAKYTYRERVVYALSSLQTPHHKRLIHLASIKAQVKKEAQKKNDKLGPRWHAFITKAVHQLENDGILSASERSPGYIEISPSAKKALTEARRVLGVTGSPSASQEDGVVKYVLRQSFAHGTKRAHDGPDAVPSKRARTSSSSDGPWMKKKKVELVAEIKRLQSMTDMRATSPLTDLDDDEFAYQRGSNIELRSDQEIGMVDRVHNSSDAGDTPTRLSTPTAPLITFADPPRFPDPLVHRRPLLGVTRTLSGSLLSNLSKRPTPAPSSPGSDYANIDNDFPMTANTGVDDIFSDRNHEDHHAVLGRNRLATPDSTPSRSTSSGSPDTGSLAREAPENASSEKGSSIASVNAEIVSLQTSKLSLEGQVAELKASNSKLLAASIQSSDRIAQLESQLSDSARQMAPIQGAFDSKSRELVAALRMFEASNTELDIRTRELLDTQRMTADLKDETATLQTQLDTCKSLNASLADEIVCLKSVEADLTAKLAVAEDSAESSLSHVLQKNAELDRLRGDLQTAEESVQVSQATLAEAEARHADATEQHSLTSASLNTLVLSLRTETAQLRSEYDEASTVCNQLRAELEQTSAAKSHLREELDALTLRSSSTKAELNRAMEHIRELEVELQQIEVSKAADEGTIKNLKDTILRIQAAQMEQWTRIGEQVNSASASEAPKRRARFSL